MKQYEASAKTVEEAIEHGLQELGVSIGDVDVQVVEEGSKGLFGLFGSRLAKVRLTVKEAVADPLEGLMTEKVSAGKAQMPKKQEKKPADEKNPANEKKPEERPELAKVPETDAAEKKSEEKKSEEKKSEEKKPAGKQHAEKKPSGKKPPEKPAVKKQPPEEAPEAVSDEETAPEGGDAAKPSREIRKMEKPEVTMIPADQLDPESAAGRAHAFLMELTRLMGVEVTIDMGTDAEGNVYGNMQGDTLGILIGRRGETLDAVQYLTSLRVNRDQENYTRVTLDTENYRAKREETLIRLANRMANRAMRTGRKVSLEPMNPYERRIIHFALQQHEGVMTHSEGEEPNRHVVITHKK